MTKYYKGNLVLNNNLTFNAIKFETNHSCFEDESINIENSSAYTTEHEKYILSLNYFANIYEKDGLPKKRLNYASEQYDDTVHEIINRNKKYSKVQKSIIYEKVFDKNGNIYAKEFNTGIIFPLLNFQDFTTFAGISLKGEYDNKHYEITLEASIKLRQNFDLINCYCIEEKVLDYNEIQKYKKRLNSKSFQNFKIQYLKNKLQALASINIPNSEINLKSDFKEQSKETKTMEEIEYLLCILKETNENLYLKYNQKYKEILYGNSLNITNPTLDSLKSIENAIRLDLVTSSDNIINYLDSLICNYLNLYINNTNKTINITLDELDNINELFLNQNKNYNVQTERAILKKIAFAFLLIVKENINDITVEDLENSYFSQHKKTIIIIIKSLISENIINLNIDINLKKELEIPQILEIIKNIEFNAMENQNSIELIKKLGNW